MRYQLPRHITAAAGGAAAVADSRHAAAVIGPGRVGRTLSRMSVPPSPLYGRGSVLPQQLQGPIWVCTTNNALEDVVQRCVAPSQRQQLVFVQNGMLLPWLATHGLQHNTQVLLYMSATEDGKVTDGGRTVVCGSQSSHVVQLLQHGGVSCKQLGSWQEYHRAMVVKLLWSCIFWLLSAGLGGATVGNVVQQHAGAVEALVSELLPIAAEYLAAPGSAAVPTAVQQPQGWLQRQDQQQQDPDKQLRQSQQVQHEPSSPASNRRSSSTGRSSQLCGLDQASVTQQLVEYSLAIAAAVPSADMARREFTWRNGWFLGRRVTPQHEHWLLRAGCQDLLLQHARC
ncbi:hypothetical protein COO60DRAFT_269918 [Scenedesmus sp. NREL 46B-D3]|nr:hypothetical protein COO60DRAFT_269918 [Scenedesmus sp. NREL 46B-D3]